MDIEKMREGLVAKFKAEDVDNTLMPWLQQQVSTFVPGIGPVLLQRIELFEMRAKSITDSVVQSNLLEGERVQVDPDKATVQVVLVEIFANFRVVKQPIAA